MLVWPSVCVALIFISLVFGFVTIQLIYDKKDEAELHQNEISSAVKESLRASTQNCTVNALVYLVKSKTRIDSITRNYHNLEDMSKQLGLENAVPLIHKIDLLIDTAEGMLRKGEVSGFFQRLSGGEPTQ
jgi:hypothetical protein